MNYVSLFILPNNLLTNPRILVQNVVKDVRGGFYGSEGEICCYGYDRVVNGGNHIRIRIVFGICAPDVENRFIRSISGILCALLLFDRGWDRWNRSRKGDPKTRVDLWILVWIFVSDFDVDPCILGPENRRFWYDFSSEMVGLYPCFRACGNVFCESQKRVKKYQF